MKNIIAVGGQGFLKDCIFYLSFINDVTFKGVLSDNGFVPNIDNINILGDINNYKISDNDYFIICAGDIKLRKYLFEKIKNIGGKFYTLTHNTPINSSIELGEGNIFVNCDLTVDIKIGNGNLFNNRVTIGHDVQIGDFNFIGPNSQFLGNSLIGDLNSIGTSTVLLPKSKIGSGNIIAPLSAVYKGCKDNKYLQGNPAQTVGNVNEE